MSFALTRCGPSGLGWVAQANGSFPPIADISAALSIPNRAVNSVSGGQDRRATHLLIANGNRSPEVVERPAFVGKVGQEGEREAKRELPFDRRSLGLFGYLIDSR